MRKNYKQFFFTYYTLFWVLILPSGNGLLYYFMYLPFTRTIIPFEWLGHSLNIDIVGFTLIGQLVYTFFLSTLMAGAIFDREREQGTFELVLLSPSNRLAILLGNTLGTSIRYLWLMIGTIAIFSLSFNVGILINDFAAVFLSLLLSFLALLTFGLSLAAFSIHSRRGGLIAIACQEPVAYVSGLVVPQNALPQTLAQAGYLIPLTIGLIAMRLSLLGGAMLQDIQLLLGVLLIMIVVYVVLAHFLVKIAEKSAKEKGTLALF
jgi:ABC-2 type transport system permease protein